MVDQQQLRVGVVCSSGLVGGGENYLVALYSGAEAEQAVLLGTVTGWEHTGRSTIDIGLGEKWSKRTVWRSVRRLLTERRRGVAHITRRHRESPFDLFHCQYKREQLLFTGPLSKHAPVVWTEHGTFPTSLLYRCITPWYRRAARQATAIICVSETVAANLRTVLGDQAPLVVVNNGVDVTRFQDVAPVDPTSNRPRMVLGVAARLNPKKRHERAVRVAAALNADLVIAGDGDDRDHLSELGRQLGVSLRFLGHLEDVSTLFEQVDAMVVCGQRQGEGSSLTALEAASAGRAAICFGEDPMIADIVGRSGGWVLDDSTVVPAISRQDCHSRGAYSRQWVQQRDISHWRTETFNTFAAAVDRHRSRRRVPVRLPASR